MAKTLSTNNSSSTKRAPRASKKPTVAQSDVLVVQSLETTSVEGGDDFAELLANLGVVAAADEVVEPTLSDEVLEAAVSSAEATEVMIESATVDAEVPADAVPSEGEVAADAPTMVTAEGDAVEAAPAADAEVKTKKAPTPRKHYSDKVERLKDRVGASLSEYTVLTTADAMVDEDALAEVMERTLGVIRAMNKKEQNRASNFIEFLSGKKARLNNVLQRVLVVLARDGFITTGAEGNIMKDLLGLKYSIASARAMSGNTIGMYADLKVILPEGKGKFVANGDSLLLMKAKSLLAAAESAAPTEGAGADEGAGDTTELEAALEAAVAE